MQVILCLQSNALKFTSEGHVKVIASIETISQDVDNLKIVVEDTGIGINENNKNKIFKLFGLIKDSLHMNKNGIGLGLVIARLVTHEFGGNMNFDSEEGQGTRFYFNFQLNKPAFNDYRF